MFASMPAIVVGCSLAAAGTAAGGHGESPCSLPQYVSLVYEVRDRNTLMSTSDAFALPNSGFNAFLFAEVGTELNGSPLTILSVLARLGQDPWAEAAKWAKLPKATTIDRLEKSISQMPLSPQSLVDAHSTASRLIQLLPSQTVRLPEMPTASKASVPKWVLVAVCCAAVALGFAFNFMSASTPAKTITPISDLPAGQPRPPAR